MGKEGRGHGSWFTAFQGPMKLIFHFMGFNSNSELKACEFRLKFMGKTKQWSGTIGRLKACAFMLSDDNQLWSKMK